MSSESRNLAALSHILQLFFGFIPALIFFLAKPDDEFVREHSKEVLNFQITLMIGYFAAFILSFVLIGVVLYFVLPILTIVFGIIAGMKSYEGEMYRYPMTIRLIK